MTCGGVTFFFHLKTSFCFFPPLFSMSLLPREPWKKAKILNYDICSLDWFHTHRFTLTHKHISNLSKTLLAGLKMIWYFPIICMHVTSCMIVILTMLLSSIINMPVAWVPILFIFLRVVFQTVLYGPLQAEGFVPSVHSKLGDLSCHCSWLTDCMFSQKAYILWSFRTLANSRFVLAWTSIPWGIIAW